MDRVNNVLRYFSIALIICILCSGYTFPSGAPHVHLINNGVTYDIYFAGSNFRDAFIYDSDTLMLINTYSSTITGYTVYQGIDRTISFPVYDYGNMRINNTTPAQYIYFNNVTECEFINFSEYAFWKHDLTSYLLFSAVLLLFITFIKR